MKKFKETKRFRKNKFIKERFYGKFYKEKIFEKA